VENKKKENRLRILEAASRLFYYRRFHEVKMEEIAEAAGMGKGTIYEYFSSKEDLFCELFKYSTEKYIRLACEASRKENNCRGKLLALLLNHIDFLTRFRHLEYYVFNIGRINFREMQPWFKEKKNQFLSLVEESISEGMRRGEIRELNARLAATVFTGSFLVALNPFLIDVEKNGKIYAAEVLDLFFQGIERP
jgi:AcrR family transcriptional regulator